MKKLFKLLKLIDGVSYWHWNIVLEIVECFQKQGDKITIINKNWDETYKQNNLKSFPLNLDIINTWSTHDGAQCIDIKFSVKDEKLNCKAKIYDGNSFNGHREKLRFQAEFILPNSFIKKIENKIEYSFMVYLNSAYEDHLEAEKKLWIEKTKSETLNNFK